MTLKADSRAPAKRRALAATSLALTAALASAACTASTDNSSQASPSGEPGEPANILMILVDDLGYTDLGSYGGEAMTPNIDALADELQFTNFHAYPSCAPSRAALVTGQDPHQVGMGSQNGFVPPGVPAETPGYSGSLEGDFRGIAEVLGETGYATYQVGKWHLGSEEGQTPADLGFEENFSLHESHASHFSDALLSTPRQSGEHWDTAHYERNGETVRELPEDFYSTHAYTDEMIRLIGSGEHKEPFFGYLAYTAVHDPLHVPDQARVDHYLALYKGKNDYEKLRTERIDRLVEAGLIPEGMETRWPAQVDAWADVSEKRKEDLARRMAVYAAMIEDVDTQIGRVLDHLKQIDEYDDTLVVVASDNGAAGPGRHLYTMPTQSRTWQDDHYPRTSDVEAHGQPGSYPTLSLPGAQVSSGPLFHSKATVFEGGTRAPMVVKLPGAEPQPSRVIDAFTHVTDLYPTFADYAGIELEDPALLGSSAREVLEGASDRVGSDEFGMEYLGSRTYRDGDWKIVFTTPPFGGTGDWALYDLAKDLGEVNDVSEAHPEIVERLATAWDKYAEANGVVPVSFNRMNTEDKLDRAAFAPDWIN